MRAIASGSEATTSLTSKPLFCGFNPLAPQVVDEVQLSATSHGPAERRHVLPAPTNESPGQLALDPVQLSPTSHRPAEPRHVRVHAILVRQRAFSRGDLRTDGQSRRTARRAQPLAQPRRRDRVAARVDRRVVDHVA
jgi:hypothetical protein